MEPQSNHSEKKALEMLLPPPSANGGGDMMKFDSNADIVSMAGNMDDVASIFRQNSLQKLADLLTRLPGLSGKKSFLVLRHNKYVNVLTENIAFFYIKYESAVIMCFDKQEYFVNYSLDQLQRVLSGTEFFRLNRQYLINFSAVKDVEHYFARKLLVNPVIPTKDKLIVSKERVTEFLRWLDNR